MGSRVPVCFGKVVLPDLDVRRFAMFPPKSSLQVAEFAGLVRGLRLSYFKGLESVSMVGDVLCAYKEKLLRKKFFSAFV